MQKSFAKNVDLEWLIKHIAEFFEIRKFEDIVATKNDSGYDLIAGNSSKYKIKSDLRVIIQRNSEGFSVSFELVKEAKRFNYPVFLATFFGGGYFFLKDLKSDESWTTIGREFWQEVSATIMKAKESGNPPDS